MASDAESLRALEGLMTEFFDAGTTNDRKRGIEELLNNFSQQKDAWKHCMYFMSETSNEYVMMYCLTVLEGVINRQWVGLSNPEKVEIRSTLDQFLLSRHLQLPSFIRNKLVKLVVDIGRSDWPHFHPDFFNSILQLLQQGETAALGLVLLQTTSEELACPREDLSVARKDELHHLLLSQVPTVLTILNGILESILEKHRHLMTTPPPSPTHSGTHETPDQGALEQALFSSTPAQQGSLLSNMFKSPQSRVQTDSIPPLDASSQQVATLALNCLAHLFSWIPLSKTITPNILSTIFHFAAFGCEVSTPAQTSSPGSGFSLGAGHQSVGVIAMCCINELLAKNCVPQEFEDYLLQMFQQTFYLLQRLTKDTSVNTTRNKLAELEESYLDKFTEFLRLFVSIHLRRFEANNQFAMLDFLGLLFKYTFKQPTNEGFFTCLDIWSVFLDYLSTKLTNRIADQSGLLDRYREALLSLVSNILQKFQFRYNQSQLEELDDESHDDDVQYPVTGKVSRSPLYINDVLQQSQEETEWQHFLRECLEVIAKVAELLPAEVFRLVYEPFREFLDIYFDIERYIVSSPQGTRLNITAENECRKLHCTLRDLSSILQAVGRLADHFIAERFVERFNDALPVIECLVHTCAYGARVKPYEASTAAASVLKADFIEAHAQALATVKAYATWLAQFHIEGASQPEQKEKCDKFLESLISTVLPAFNKQTPEKVVLSSSHLFLSLMTTIRAQSLLQNPAIISFYKNVSQGVLQKLNPEVQLLMYRSLSHYLLLPWPNLTDTDQDWGSRAALHNDFLSQLLAQYKQLNAQVLAENRVLQQEARQCVKRTLQILTDLTESIAVDGVSRSKQIYWQSLQDLVQVTLALFPIYIHQPDVTDDVLRFFLSLFKFLKVQMGPSFTEQTIKTFMSMFTREQLTETIMHESSAGCRVVEKFLKILQVIVQEPGSAFKTFLPSIISICMEQIYPIIAERPSPDIKPTLYELLHELLQNKWRYFFKTSVLSSLHSKNDVMENQQQFISIMQAFGQSFLQPDIAIFRQNLEALEHLNSKWKLFQRKIFQEVMLYQFLNVLIQVLVHKSHDLLQEEIGITVYNMASVNFDSFYSNFLPQFLSSIEGVDDNQKTILGHNFKMDRDLPSFTQSIHRLVNDIRYFRRCNQSLPEGSVRL